MKGTVLDFNEAERTGIISGDNGNHYSFSMKNVIGNAKISGASTVGQIIVFMCLLLFSQAAVASEVFISGTYQDVAGNQYLVSGGAPSLTGRAQWTITSTIPVAGTTNTFNAIWETGAAVGNTYLAGLSSVTTFPAGYPRGRSYGVTSDNNFAWGTGATFSASQVGTTLVFSLLTTNGSVARSFTLSFVRAGGATTASSTTYLSGTYKDASGNQYLVLGGAPSLTGRAQWTITSTIPVAGTTNTFNAIWETGPAVGNTYLAALSSVTTFPAGYTGGRSYGVTSDNNFAWGTGATLSASQVGTTLVFSLLTTNGSVARSFTLSFVRAGGATAASSTTYLSGTYKDVSGNQYLISGGAPSLIGRVQWSITSTTPVAGTTNTFNALWETGAAVGNTLLAGNRNVANFPAGYTGGRSYGVTSNNNFAWGTGATFSVSQVGTTLVVSLLTANGSVARSFTLSFISSPKIFLSVDQTGGNFRTGDSLSQTFTTEASTPVTNADIYIALQLPNGALLIQQPNGSFSTVIITPQQANTPVLPTTNTVFNYTFTGAEPLGTYIWYAALMQPGTMNVIGTIAAYPFTFAP